jgi:hypothetical protein
LGSEYPFHVVSPCRAGTIVISQQPRRYERNPNGKGSGARRRTTKLPGSRKFGLRTKKFTIQIVKGLTKKRLNLGNLFAGP